MKRTITAVAVALCFAALVWAAPIRTLKVYDAKTRYSGNGFYSVLEFSGEDRTIALDQFRDLVLCYDGNFIRNKSDTILGCDAPHAVWDGSGRLLYVRDPVAAMNYIVAERREFGELPQAIRDFNGLGQMVLTEVPQNLNYCYFELSEDNQCRIYPVPKGIRVGDKYVACKQPFVLPGPNNAATRIPDRCGDWNKAAMLSVKKIDDQGDAWLSLDYNFQPIAAHQKPEPSSQRYIFGPRGRFATDIYMVMKAGVSKPKKPASKKKKKAK